MDTSFIFAERRHYCSVYISGHVRMQKEEMVWNDESFCG